MNLEHQDRGGLPVEVRSRLRQTGLNIAAFAVALLETVAVVGKVDLGLALSPAGTVPAGTVLAGTVVDSIYGSKTRYQNLPYVQLPAQVGNKIFFAKETKR